MQRESVPAPSIGVIVVSFNQYEQTAAFIRRFLALYGDDSSLYLLVLDNNSADGSYERLRLEFPDVDIRALNDNYGCVTGRNIGIVALDAMGCKYVYVSDNDIILADRLFFRKLEAFHEKYQEIDASSPVVLWGDDRSVQTLGTQWVLGSLTKNVTVPNGVQRMTSLPGCAQFVRMDAFKRFGLYDNDFTPVSIEDYEWGIRASSLGAMLVNFPDVQVIHLHDRNRKDSPTMQQHYLVGRIKYLRKYFTVLRLLDEIRFVTKNFARYGMTTLFRGYRKGLTAVLHGNNYDFTRFVQAGLSQYYKESSPSENIVGSFPQQADK